MTLSLLGLGAILSASTFVFSLFKWIGAAYLILLGIRKMGSRPEETEVSCKSRRENPGTLFRSSYLVTLLNPKSIAFFVAFFPQFIISSAPLKNQMLLLGGTFLALAFVNAFLYAFFAGAIHEKMRQGRFMRCLNRLGGAVLICAGIVTAALKKTAS